MHSCDLMTEPMKLHRSCPDVLFRGRLGAAAVYSILEAIDRRDQEVTRCRRQIDVLKRIGPSGISTISRLAFRNY